MRKKYNSYLIAFVIYIYSVPLNGIQVISNISPTFSNAKVSHAKKKEKEKKEAFFTESVTLSEPEAIV